MMRSLYSGVTGLKSHQTKMDVIGNNIANVNTVGFKTSTVNFADLFSQTISSASGPTGNNGGTNAQQIGLGVSVNSITLKFTPGAAQYSGRTLDVAINGDGFFVVDTGNTGEPEYKYTRAGNFSIAPNGFLVNPDGYKVQCFNAIYQPGTIGWPEEVGWSDSAATPTLGLNSFSFDYDPAETAATPSGTYEFLVQEGAGGNMEIRVLSNGVDVTTSGITISEAGGAALAPGDAFAADTDYEIHIPQVGTFTFKTGAAGATWNDVMADLDGKLRGAAVDMFNNDKAEVGSVMGPMQIDRNMFTNVSIGKDGAIIAQLEEGAYLPGSEAGTTTMGATAAKGMKIVLGYLSLANFNNQEGLEKTSSNLYRQTPNSGDAFYSAPGYGGTGDLTPSSLEMSNVDLADEMVSMITTQRGFQANSRIITTTDSMLEELVNLKR